ncbi:MAG: hypothetical protein UX25_C0026G0008 [Candidatus Woesebacteria bacterium GW2011_GWC2_45_9]|uniref:Uncharacterized protein n=1 Tax=Candidatus Woesebacteria bacterium GW2011_GWC2_45_9 TaxID=1618589 RepID=A0A0G1R720_9BACT|nr:MAG: hypothetical protein UX25_C0026G0008 [Candidatus Woesebacteria bacterium GW2011_GWC2_45_9]
MLTIRYFIRFFTAFIVRFRGIILLGTFLGAVVFLALRILGPSLLTSSTQRVGIVGRYRVENLPDSVLALIGNGLTKIKEDGTRRRPNLGL